MKELVILPTFQRPEMLTVCLEAIRAAEPDIAIHVFPDRGTNETEVCARFGAVHHLTWQHQYHGNTANVLEALKWADARLPQPHTVFVIEDDCIIDPDFFTWSRNALTNPPFGEQPFAACGWRYSPDQTITDGPDQLLSWYLSVCAALPSSSVHSLIAHARPEYYSDMPGYLARIYPSSHRRNSMHYEQDGLALRVAESESKRCVWPRRPHATHVGWRGYHQIEGLEASGTLAERVEVVRLAVRNPELLTNLMNGGRPPEMTSCEGCSRPLLVGDKKARVICVSCYHASHTGLVTTGSHYYLSPARLQTQPS